MIIYIPVEIPVRELPGYLLLAAVATSRGHQVMITSGVDLWMYKRLNLLSRGCYLLKNMNIPEVSNSVYKGFLSDGFDLYCQEQEPSILYGQFQSYLDTLNIKKNQAIPFKGVFCWGKRDTEEFKNFFDSIEDTFYNTGSLRLDIWKEKYKCLYKNFKKKPNKPYILIISNFSYVMGKNHWSKISLVERSLEMLETQEREDNYFNKIQHELLIAGNMILAAKSISKNYPEYEILLRPHPSDLKENWENVFINNSNIRVIDNNDSITPWILNASAIIQNGCTSAIESVIQKRPIVSYGPDRVYDDLSIPNMLGLRARNIKELDESLDSILNNKNYSKVQMRSEDAIRSIVSIDKENTALEIIKIMEAKSKSINNETMSNSQLRLIKLAKFIKSNIDKIRKLLGVKGLDIRDPSIDIVETKEMLAELSSTLGIPAPKLKKLHKSLLFLS